MNLNNSAPVYPTDPPPTYQEAIGKSDHSIEDLAKKFIINTETICESNRLDIKQCRKSLFARVIKQLNERIPEPFILPIELSVLTNPTDYNRWDWEQWQRNVNLYGRDKGYEAIEEIGEMIRPDDTRKFLLDFLPKIVQKRFDHASIDCILSDRPFEAVSGIFRVHCIPAKDFIVAAISKGLVDEGLANKIYAKACKNPASSCTPGASNSQLPDYRASFSELEVNTARKLAGEFFTMATAQGYETHADRMQLMRRFTSILNETYQCEISVMGINPEQFGNNPTRVTESDWLTWQMAVYQEDGEYFMPRDEEIIEKIEWLLSEDSDLTPQVLYTAFKSSPDILDLKFDFGEEDLNSGKDLLESSLAICRTRCQPVTKILTGLIKFGCLSKETIDAIYSLGLNNLSNAID
ncbi:hypothetical protein [Endozoicomonas sp. SCSIO W0465]|uniref:hypothetical protein n=1 Tax=Endozoicomonas sp. SCSIO W0465 TaxID=2918516 RepID=UPI002075B40C|nr:hypothetical protein [Endozoicomonas sp. SCSIO W0465]USE34775.1 hypothetical protein MJO57_21980 [Endozoicomonas sp. SCSIO W0465]